jgi:hypothetical protein
MSSRKIQEQGVPRQGFVKKMPVDGHTQKKNWPQSGQEEKTSKIHHPWRLLLCAAVVGLQFR